MAKGYSVQKNCVIFPDFLLPWGHDVVVVSTEYVFSIAIMGRFYLEFSRCVLILFFHLCERPQYFKKQIYLALTLTWEERFLLCQSAHGVFLAGNISIVGKCPKYPLFSFPPSLFSLACGWICVGANL